MYKKLMLSAAAAMTLSTAGFGFDSDVNGNIYALDNGVYYDSSYKDGEEANEKLDLSINSQYGDALIYPRFKSDDNWTTDISVRNSSDNAVVAKVVLYAADDSRELRDFNIYLSGSDVFTFKVKDGNVTTKDGSINTVASIPSLGADKDNATFVTHEGNTTHTITTLNDDEKNGYIVIYGMAQSDTDVGGGEGYHNKHLELFKDYRLLLDSCRTNSWRTAYADNDGTSGFIKHGMLSTATDIQAPNVDLNKCGTINSSVNTVENPKITTFTSVEPVLVGSVKLSNDQDEKRDMRLPATALSNFTPDSQNLGMLWTEGEYAAIQDRRIDDDKYDGTGIREDAETFVVKDIEYTYNDSDSANQLVFTQPMKRILVQLSANDNESVYYNGITRTDVTSKDSKSLSIVSSYGCFKASNTIYDENEQQPGSAPTDTSAPQMEPFISPYTTNQTNAPVIACGFPNEMQILTDSDLQDVNTTEVNAMNQNGGFVSISINGTTNGIPAIVTQKTGSVVGTTWQTNWVYAPTKN